MLTSALASHDVYFTKKTRHRTHMKEIVWTVRGPIKENTFCRYFLQPIRFFLYEYIINIVIVRCAVFARKRYRRSGRCSLSRRRRTPADRSVVIDFAVRRVSYVIIVLYWCTASSCAAVQVSRCDIGQTTNRLTVHTATTCKNRDRETHGYAEGLKKDEPCASLGTRVLLLSLQRK